MSITTFECTDKYKHCFDEYTRLVTEKYGVSSESGDRETMYLASVGNCAAKKAYADLVFFRHIPTSDNYGKAFSLYLEAADITVDESGNSKCGGNGVPQAFAMIAYYLYNYKRDGHVKSCKTIEAIENLGNGNILERIRISLYLSVSCLCYVKMPMAINLIGRILDEASRSDSVFDYIKEDINALLVSNTSVDSDNYKDEISGLEECRKASDFYYNLAASNGYVYACNNLATREADIIVGLCHEQEKEGADLHDITASPSDEIKEHIEKYLGFLTVSAKKFEPYASNKLGLFYISGEIIDKKKEKVFFRSYCNSSLAKEYFINATLYPNKNSAWAYYNLIKFFPKDYSTNIDLLGEHMGCIKRLDPAVYDLAIED